jgi:hypothetical protein
MVLALLLAGCGKTNAAAIEELTPQFSVVRKNLAALTVLEFAAQKVLSRLEVHGQPDQVVKYAVKPGESKAVEAALAVHSSMWVDARNKLFDGLTTRGASITLR